MVVYEWVLFLFLFELCVIIIVLSLYWYFPLSLFLLRSLSNFPFIRDWGGGDKHLYYGFAHGFRRTLSVWGWLECWIKKGEMVSLTRSRCG